MDVTNMTAEQKNCLQELKKLEGRMMKCGWLTDLLDNIDFFYKNSWFFTEEDYNNYGDNGELEYAFDMIHSGDDVECPEPYITPDGKEQHWNGMPLFEIFFTYDSDPDRHPGDDDAIRITDVDIHIPDEYWK